jgi:hypothetical protein
MKTSPGLLSAGLATCGGIAAIVRASGARLSVSDLVRDPWFNLAVAVTGLGAVLGCVALARRRDPKSGAALGALGLVAAVFGAIGSVIAHLGAVEQYSHGRPFRRGKRPLTAASGAGEAWLEEVALETLPPEPLRAELAAEWRRNGMKEHASIAAFSRLSLDLIAVSAPAELLAEVQGDALDEIRHARLCFSVAHALDGRTDGPGHFPEARARARALPTRSLVLAQLAIDAVIDGALNEGVSARLLARLAGTCTDPALAALLRGMAADEAKHAAHSWNVVAFCMESGGAPVVAALRGALGALPAMMTAEIPAGARGGAWEAYGVQGEALEREAWSSARRHGVEKLEALLDGARSRRPRVVAPATLSSG